MESGVEPHDVVPVLHQEGGEDGADVAFAAGHEDAHRWVVASEGVSNCERRVDGDPGRRGSPVERHGEIVRAPSMCVNRTGPRVPLVGRARTALRSIRPGRDGRRHPLVA